MLYRLLAVTAVGMYAVAALHAPDDAQPLGAATASAAEIEKDSPGAPDADAVEVGRSAFSALGFTLAGMPARTETGPTEAEAIRIAIERGRAIKDARETGKSGVVFASFGVNKSTEETRPEPVTETETATAPAPASDPLWTVTGSTVNLRAGPGTNHAVVGQVRAGDLAAPVGATDGDWIEIVVSETGTRAFIFARFLRPGQG